MSTKPYHLPVMCQKAIDYLVTNPKGIYVDLTFGGGGHARSILEKISDAGSLWAFDQDKAALQKAEEFKASNFNFIRSNFRFFGQFLRSVGIEKVDGILVDLGVSSHQLDRSDRGFAARLDGPLDMRMAKENTVTAADILDKFSLEELRFIFRTHSDIANAHKLAHTILTYRKKKKISTTGELCEVIANCTIPNRRYQYFAKVFQALRIVVNDEMGALKEMLEELPQILAPEGRVVIISYHSGEDRLVKHFFQYGNIEGNAQKDFYGNLVRPLEPVERRVVVPENREKMENNRARSARLRVAKRISLSN